MQDTVMTDKTGKYSMIASIASSVVFAGVFALLAVLKNSSRTTPLYSTVDIVAGVIFVFILSMIVSASVWPGIMEKRQKKPR
jgi:glucan phosphoethanolaminetransferase (alkaline phosphatase superfamily)